MSSQTRFKFPLNGLRGTIRSRLPGKEEPKTERAIAPFKPRVLEGDRKPSGCHLSAAQ